MSCTYFDIRDAVYVLFKEQWDLLVPPIIDEPEAPEVFFDNLDDPDREPDGDFYAEVSLVDTFSDQRALGEKGRRLFAREAILTVRIHTPGGVGPEVNDKIAHAVVGIFEGNSLQGICFRRTRRVGIGPTGSHYLTNVVTELEYDERK